MLKIISMSNEEYEYTNPLFHESTFVVCYKLNTIIRNQLSVKVEGDVDNLMETIRVLARRAILATDNGFPFNYKDIAIVTNSDIMDFMDTISWLNNNYLKFFDNFSIVCIKN